MKDPPSQADIDRILDSETFRKSEILRRLLSFLAEKSIAGEADTLKEYTIGIDALGKSPKYDPRQDASVRIQVSRLRQKLNEHYLREGKNDPIVIDVPKGHFKLIWDVQALPRSLPVEAAVLSVQTQANLIEAFPKSATTLWRKWTLVVLLFLVVAGSLYAARILFQKKTRNLRAGISPELEELWKPFLTSDRPVIVAVATPLFVDFPGLGEFRDRTVNTWKDAQTAPRLQAVRKSLHDPPMEPIYFAPPSELSAVFNLGRILSFSVPNLDVMRADLLSQAAISGNNLIFVGVPRIYRDQLAQLPDQPEFEVVRGGVSNLHPRANEPAIFKDDYQPGTIPTPAPDNGELYALVTHVAGSMGEGDIETFMANHHPGTLGAVDSFTNPTLANEIVMHLRKSNGEIPRYFQIVLKVKYKDSVPMDVSYVTHRELPAPTRSGK